ncbi:MAG: hypothetical protein WA110_01715 [Anaerolineaceae bacterium]
MTEFTLEPTPQEAPFDYSRNGIIHNKEELADRVVRYIVYAPLTLAYSLFRTC